MNILYYCIKRVNSSLNLFVIIVVLFTNCQKEDDIPYFIELSDNIIEFPSDASTKSLTLNANGSWGIISDIPDWLSIDMLSGEGTDRISLTVSDNDSYELRRAVIVFSCDDIQQTLIVRQEAIPYLYIVGDKEIDMLSRGGEISVEIRNNVRYKVKIISDDSGWIEMGDGRWANLAGGSKASYNSNNSLQLTVKKNELVEPRSADVLIFNEQYMLSDILHITQQGKDDNSSVDNSVKVLQRADKGNADLVIMGDGFTSEYISTGVYQQIMERAMDYFFSIEPYASYREYFNVYSVDVESETEGFPEKVSWGGKKSAFEISFGDGTAINCNDEIVFEYAYKINDLQDGRPLTVIVVLNCDKYAGTAYMFTDGSSIALCPMSTEEPPNDFEGIVHHEAGGHAFGLLCDEYVYYQKTMPLSRIRDIQEFQEYGFYLNLDFTDNLSEILWNDFIGLDKYPMVGAYEGGYEYQYGVWRSEENSCMNNNIPYYNVQSRWVIAKRIMDLSGIPFDVQDFIAADDVQYPYSKSYWANPFPPLGEPVIMERSY